MTELKTRSQHDEFVASNKLAIVKYSASWCNPCKTLGKVLSEMSDEELSGFRVADLDCEEDEFIHLCDESKIRNLPTLFFYVDGNLVKRVSGTQTKAGIMNTTSELAK